MDITWEVAQSELNLQIKKLHQKILVSTAMKRDIGQENAKNHQEIQDIPKEEGLLAIIHIKEAEAEIVAEIVIAEEEAETEEAETEAEIAAESAIEAVIEAEIEEIDPGIEAEKEAKTAAENVIEAAIEAEREEEANPHLHHPEINKIPQ
eukprot:TRINITY_DN5412_c0_g1_i1.p2 TRINITY_DN5412_c0_g1~~TRINITY_DN5412_c0_g1_i1.p2  ORF type:complete len:150 (-),score=57.34 TRINITY_DN5412_c0_g1_i1:337-786(-)